MADIKTIALPLPSQEFDSNNEAVTRRLIEQAIEDINARITLTDKMKSTTISKASRRQQFLLMGMKHG
jgi:hypothetical protein|tara:strand:- start:6157 stop:6360 length:204 start_codon:yes stop_codon:yes gene_type:complete